MDHNFELLLARDNGNFYTIIGITYSNAMRIEPDCVTLRASLFTIEQCKQALKDGKKITVSKIHEYSELLPHDLIINMPDELTRAKTAAINEISARIQLAIFSVNVIDLIEYLNNYIALLNAGYYVTDSNREDKYFEVIEASLEYEEPEALKEDATFEQELEYIEKKQKYDIAQANLNILEKYLNSYDKISHLRTINQFLTESREKIEQSTNIEEVDTNMKIFRSNLINYQIVKTKE